MTFTGDIIALTTTAGADFLTARIDGQVRQWRSDEISERVAVVSPDGKQVATMLPAMISPNPPAPSAALFQAAQRGFPSLS